MSNTSEKLSASLRKAKAQETTEVTQHESAPNTPRKTVAKQPSKSLTAGSKSARRRKEKPKPGEGSPRDSHQELFPSRVWPD